MKELACGCVPWRRAKNGEIEALMILRTGGYWEFPKGKKEPSEQDTETALRELKEETGLVGELGPEEPIEVSYVFVRDDVEVEKQVKLFVCRVSDGAAVVEAKREVSDHTWLPLEDLMDRATYPEMKDAARKAWQLLAD